MFPTTFIDKIECMQSLVGIRTGCTVDQQYPFWLEDIEGVDVKKLSSMSKASNPNGKDFGKQLINNAARQMMGDIETLLNDGYKMQNIIGDMCSSCQPLPVYTPGTGIIAKSTVATRFSIMRLSKLTILANVSGEKQIVIDDGETQKFYTVTLVAGTLMPIVMNYSTIKKIIKISFVDNTVPLGIINCPKSSSCGCGGSVNSNNPITITGMTAGIETANQYGFLPCIAIDCSYDSLVCNLINQTPNIFGLALLYKVGELYYDNKKVADRNNDAVGYNEDEGGEQQKNYARLYWAKIKGTAGVNGVNKIINDYLKTNRADKCVICESKIKTAYVTG